MTFPYHINSGRTLTSEGSLDESNVTPAASHQHRDLTCPRAKAREAVSCYQAWRRGEALLDDDCQWCVHVASRRRRKKKESPFDKKMGSERDDDQPSRAIELTI